jgi:hypothetical protein
MRAKNKGRAAWRTISSPPADGHDLRRLLDRGARGARARPQAPRHVHRRHRRTRAPPPRGRSPRQRDGRGRGGPRHPHRGRASRRPRRHHPRQRPRHPGGPAPEVPRQVRARGHPLHAPLGRQVLGQGLPDLRRPPRRRHLGRQRALRPRPGRGRAQPRALRAGILPRPAPGPHPLPRPHAEPPRHHRHLPRRRGDLRPPPHEARAPPQDGALQGLPLLGRRDPLEVPHRRRRDADGGHLPLPRRPLGLPGRDAGPGHHLHRPPLRGQSPLRAQVRRAGLRRMGHHLDPLPRRLHPVLLQHRPHPRGRHARGRASGPPSSRASAPTASSPTTARPRRSRARTSPAAPARSSPASSPTPPSWARPRTASPPNPPPA